MSEDESFLQEIIAAPDDDGPRLVYADWLEERGDPRAEFIRVQCEEARLGDGKRRTDLRRKAKQLLQAHGKGWTAELGATGPEFRDPRYHRGFIESAKMSIRFFLKSGSDVMARTPLRQLVLTSGDKLLPKLARAEHLLQVEDLQLAERTFPERHAIEFVQSPHLEKLRSLRLHGFNYSEAFAASLVQAPFTKLAALDLERTFSSVDDGSVATLLRAPWLKSLESLRLCGLSDNTVRQIVACPNLVRLKAWDMWLSGRPFSAETARAFADSAMSRRMEQLRMMNCGMTVAGLREMAGGNWPVLTHLELNDNPFGVDGIEALATGRWPALRILNLAACRIGSRGLGTLLQQPWLKSLDRLTLRYNQLTKHDMLDLIAFQNGSRKTHIDVDGNDLNRADAEELLANLGKIGGSLAAEFRIVAQWGRLAGQ